MAETLNHSSALTATRTPWNEPVYRQRILLLRSKEDSETKLCTRCFDIKPLTAFTRMSSGRKGVHPYCRLCSSAQQRRQYAEGLTRSTRLQRLFGSGLQQYEGMLKEQDNGCAICGRRDAGRRTDRLLVDHDHVTGRVRALLCHKCNAVLGMMDDDPERLEAAARYLRAFK
jgi:hypothetical protein